MMSDQQILEALKELRPEDRKFIMDFIAMVLTEDLDERAVMLEALKGSLAIGSWGRS